MSPGVSTIRLPRVPRREWLAVGVVSAVLLLACSFRGATPLWLAGPIEGGVWIDEAERVLSGQLMYRAFFEFVPPGIVYLNAAVLAAFGRRAAVVALLHVALGCALAVAMYAVASRVIASRWRFLAPAAFLAVVYLAYSPGNHKWPALLCGLLAVNALMAGTGAARAVTAGALLGASARLTPDSGLGMTAGAAADRGEGGAPGATRRALLVVAGSAAAFGAVAGAVALIAGPPPVARGRVI